MIKTLTPMKAIRLKCLDCCIGQKEEVRNCTCTDCTLYPFRMGHRPDMTPTYDTGREVTEEQREAARIRLNKLRNRERDGLMEGEIGSSSGSKKGET